MVSVGLEVKFAILILMKVLELCSLWFFISSM
jgi:hypothetical protein